MKAVISIKKQYEFQNVYNDRRSFANKYLVMYTKENKIGYNRLGISVSKKVGNSVVRHRITRLIREGFRLNNHMLNSSFDIVVVARVSAKEKSYKEIEDAILHLCGLHKLMMAY